MNENKGSAKFVDKVVYALRKHCEFHRIPWLDSADAALVQRTIKHLMFVDEVLSTQKSATSLPNASQHNTEAKFKRQTLFAVVGNVLVSIVYSRS